MEQTATPTTVAKWLQHVQFHCYRFPVTSCLSLLHTKVANLIVSYCVINQIHALCNAVQSHFEMRYKFKCQYWKQVLRKKGKRIPSIYKHISDLWHQIKITMFQAHAWKRPICFTLYIKVEIYLQKPKMLFFRDLRAAAPTKLFTWCQTYENLKPGGNTKLG